MIRVHQVSLSDDIAGICQQMQPDKWAADNEMTSYEPKLLKKFLEANGTLVLAYDEEKIAGAALCYDLPHPSGEHSLYVHELDSHPGYRRQGVASQIMTEIMQIAKDRKHTEVWLGTETDNHAANTFYKTLKPYEIEESVIYAYKVK